MKRGILILCLTLLFLISSTGFVSAGFFDVFKIKDDIRLPPPPVGTPTLIYMKNPNQDAGTIELWLNVQGSLGTEICGFQFKFKEGENGITVTDVTAGSLINWDSAGQGMITNNGNIVGGLSFTQDNCFNEDGHLITIEFTGHTTDGLICLDLGTDTNEDGWDDFNLLSDPDANQLSAMYDGCYCFANCGKIICEELNKQGYLSYDDMMASRTYSSKYIDKETRVGYYYWSETLVSMMAKNKELTNKMKPIGVAWGKHMSYEIGIGDRDDEIGRLINEISIPLSRDIGLYLLENDAENLRMSEEDALFFYEKYVSNLPEDEIELAKYLNENIPKMFNEAKSKIKFKEKKRFTLFNFFS